MSILKAEACTEMKNVLNVGEEFLANIDVSHSRSGKTCVKQINSRKAAQVVLTKKGRRPFAIATAGRNLVVPVIRGNIVAQAMIGKDGLATICCTTITAVDKDSLSLAAMDDDFNYDIINDSAESIIDACFTVLNGEEFAILKQKA